MKEKSVYVCPFECERSIKCIVIRNAAHKCENETLFRCPVISRKINSKINDDLSSRQAG